jgi:nicotinic acid mononucleotide adenylyltransferase
MGKKVVFAWGRFNPPTIGHGVVMERVAKEAKARSADYAIFASKSNDPKKNPLTFRTKVKFLKQSFPKHSKNINASPRLRTIIDVMKFLDKKYAEVSLVVGSDRAADLKKLLNHYNGREYDFEKVEIVSAGERDPDAEGVSGMSASKMRHAAADGDYKSFKKGSPLKNPKALYDAIRNGMKINEEVYGLMESVHDRNSIKGSRFNQLLRFGLVPTKYIPITQRAFKDLKNAAPNPELRKHILSVTDKVLEYIMNDELLYRRMLLLLHDDFLFKEDQRDALLTKAQKNGFAYVTLLEVYMRGLVSSPIYGDKTAQQYAFDRVNSFVSGGASQKTMDSDIWESHIQNALNTTMYSIMDVRSFKEISESPGEWGTKDLADRYCKDTPGQPDDTANIKSLINWGWNDEIKEVAPSGKDAEDFIKGNKEKFKKRYGDKWEKVLYATAWKVYGKSN